MFSLHWLHQVWARYHGTNAVLLASVGRELPIVKQFVFVAEVALRPVSHVALTRKATHCCDAVRKQI